MEQIPPPEKTEPLSAGARYRIWLARYPERPYELRPSRKTSFIMRALLLISRRDRRKGAERSEGY